MWKQQRFRSGYEDYLNAFTDYNNANRLDERDGCYKKPGGPLTMYLVIANKPTDRQAVIESVVADADSVKAACFKKAYLGLRMKLPPFSPIVLRFRMS